jgi:hypothetical protein
VVEIFKKKTAHVANLQISSGMSHGSGLLSQKVFSKVVLLLALFKKKKRKNLTIFIKLCWFVLASVMKQL